MAMLKDYFKTAEIAIDLGGEISLEWPQSCLGWLLPEMLEFRTKNDFGLVSSRFWSSMPTDY